MLGDVVKERAEAQRDLLRGVEKLPEAEVPAEKRLRRRETVELRSRREGSWATEDAKPRCWAGPKLEITPLEVPFEINPPHHP